MRSLKAIRCLIFLVDTQDLDVKVALVATTSFKTFLAHFCINNAVDFNFNLKKNLKIHQHPNVETAFVISLKLTRGNKCFSNN